MVNIDFSDYGFRNVKAAKIKINGRMDEHVSLRFDTNGVQGGDSSSGSHAILTIESHGVNISVSSLGSRRSNFKTTSVRAEGDLELTGLILGLIRLGKELEKTYRNELVHTS